MYECDVCGYVTSVKCNFEKHKKRKNKCYGNTSGVGTSEHCVYGNKKTLTEKGNFCAEKGNFCAEKGNCVLKVNQLSCDLCKKSFCSRYFPHHICLINVKTCVICKKVFTSSRTLRQHTKNVACNRIVDKLVSSTVTNITNNFVTNNFDNSTNTNVININVFGQEDLSYLLRDKELVNKINNYSKDGVYGLVKMVDDIYLSEKRPENNTIIKPTERGAGLYIRSNNEWEYREYDDIKECIVGSLDKYIEMYHQVKKGNDIQLTDEKEKTRIKKFIVLLLTVGGMTNEELCEELMVEQLDVLDERLIKKFDKATLQRLYTKTDILFKKDNGNWTPK